MTPLTREQLGPTAHPAGPQGLPSATVGGNHVIRHNDIYCGAKQLQRLRGRAKTTSRRRASPPARTSTATRISSTWDDASRPRAATETALWGNFLDRPPRGIATTVGSVGPFPTSSARSTAAKSSTRARPHDQDYPPPFFQSGSELRRPMDPLSPHNTMLQATERESSYGLGGGAGGGGTGARSSSTTVSRTTSITCGTELGPSTKWA